MYNTYIHPDKHFVRNLKWPYPSHEPPSSFFINSLYSTYVCTSTWFFHMYIRQHKNPSACQLVYLVKQPITFHHLPSRARGSALALHIIGLVLQSSFCLLYWTRPKLKVKGTQQIDLHYYCYVQYRYSCCISSVLLPNWLLGSTQSHAVGPYISITFRTFYDYYRTCTIQIHSYIHSLSDLSLIPTEILLRS